jgi:hypothetical protein
LSVVEDTTTAFTRFAVSNQFADTIHQTAHRTEPQAITVRGGRIGFFSVMKPPPGR